MKLNFLNITETIIKDNKKEIGRIKDPFGKTTKARRHKTTTNAKTDQTKTTDDQPEALPDPTIGNDYQTSGRLLGWHASWPAGWSRNVVKDGLQWLWKGGRRPKLRVQNNICNTKESINIKV